jgi:hypothetical protein
VKLAFNREYDVEIFLRLDEVPKVRGDHLGHLGVVIGDNVDLGLLLLLLLLLLLVLLLLVPSGFVRLFVVIGVLDVVGHKALAEKT